MFKRIFSDPRHAAAELRAVLPPRIARHIEWATLEAGHANLVGTRFKQHHGDLIFRARLFDGQDAVLWLLFEHQSTVDTWMPLRVTELSLVFWNRWRERDSTARRLPAIIPVVVYHGPAPWSAATSLSQLMNLSDEASRDLEGLGVSCRFVLDDLSAASDEAISGREMEAYPKLGLVVFKYGPDKKLPDHLARYSTDIRALLATEHGIERWGVLVDYTWHVNPHLDRDEFIHRFAPLVGQEAKSTMMTLADRLRLEGHNEGHNEGHKQGQKDALSALLLQLLVQRFGPLPAEAEKRVVRAEAAELQRWALRLSDAASLDEVFAPAGQ